MAKIKVLVIDDSPFFCRLISDALSDDPEIMVVATAADAFQGRDFFLKFNPDVITLDIEMPKINGIHFLEQLMKERPTPTLIISSLSGTNSSIALRALELGAVDVIAKPEVKQKESFALDLKYKIKSAASKSVKASLKGFDKVSKPRANLQTQFLNSRDPIMVIAASTGGHQAVKKIFSSLPDEIPTCLIVLHLPPAFTQVLAQSLNKDFPFPVKEAVNGERLIKGMVYIAPGDFHIEVEKDPFPKIVLSRTAPLHSVRPAADILMKSVAKVFKTRVIGLVLSGMGRDGALGLKAIKLAGGRTYAQDEATSLVFGMPSEAIKLQCVDQVLPLDRFAESILQAFEELKKMNVP